jgi:ACT domain-containing protein
MFKTKTDGIRVTLILDEKPGQIAKLSALIAEASGNIVSMVTADTIENNARKVIVKITNITEDQFRKIAIACDAKIEDIR